MMLHYKSLIRMLVKVLVVLSLVEGAAGLVVGNPIGISETRYEREYSVFLLASRKDVAPNTKEMGDGPYDYFGDSEVEDYIELLSASGIPYRIVFPDELAMNQVVQGRKVLCVALVIATKSSELSDQTVEVLKRISGEWGVSLIASYDRVDQRLAEIFGILKVEGTKFHMPVIVRAKEKVDWAPSLVGDIPCGQGWKLRRNPGGFRRNFKKFLSQVRFYKKVQTLPGARVLAVTQDNYPALVEYRFGNSKNYYIALDSDWYLEPFNRMHQIVRQMIIENSGHGMIFFDLSNTMVLRLDDPGGSLNAFHTGLRNLELEDWKKILNTLKKHKAILNIGYVPGWVDDGDEERGELFVDGKRIVSRKGGMIFDSKGVVYVLKKKSLVFDYRSQYEGLRLGLKEGYLNVESHGLSHLNIDADAWLRSDDKYTNSDWWYEFVDFKRKKGVDPLKQEQHMKESYEKINRAFGVPPVALIPPSHGMSGDTEMIAKRVSFGIVSSEYNSILWNDFILRSDRIPSVYVAWGQPEKGFNEAGYPMVGLLHDYDLVRNGMEGLDLLLTRLRGIGVQRFISFKELNRYLLTKLHGSIQQERIIVNADLSETCNSKIRHSCGQEITVIVKLPSQRRGRILELKTHDLRSYEFDADKGLLKMKIIPQPSGPTRSVTLSLKG